MENTQNLHIKHIESAQNMLIILVYMIASASFLKE